MVGDNEMTSEYPPVSTTSDAVAGIHRTEVGLGWMTVATQQPYSLRSGQLRSELVFILLLDYLQAHRASPCVLSVLFAPEILRFASRAWQTTDPQG